MKSFSIAVDKCDISPVGDNRFLKMDMSVISDGVNRNKSEFVLESFEDGIKTIPNCPILTFYNKDTDDTEEHNSRLSIDDDGSVYDDFEYYGAEKPIGVIPLDAKIVVENVDGKNWIRISDAIVWAEYNWKLCKLLKRQKKKKVSVEVEVLDSYMDGDIEKITKWRFLGVTVLGKQKDGTRIDEAIEGACMTLKEYKQSDKFATFKAKMSFAMKRDEIANKYNLAPESKDMSIKHNKFGTGEAKIVNTDKDAVSDDAWGEVDKENLRDIVLLAENYKEIVNQVYLLVEEGWEDSPSEHLKYPVMQYKSGEFVYNSNGLLSAQQYASQHDPLIAEKAESIREKLGLTKSEREEKMAKFIEEAKDSGFVFVGVFDGKMKFVKECDDFETDQKELLTFCCGLELCDETFNAELFEEHPIACYENEPEKEQDDKFDEDEEKDIEVAEQEEDDDTEEELEDERSEDDEKVALTNKIEELQAECDCYKAKCEEYEAKLEEIRVIKMKEDTDALLSDADEDVDEETKQELSARRDAGEFKTVDEFVKELAYKKYVKDMEKKKEKVITFSINNKPKNFISTTKVDLDSI